MGDKVSLFGQSGNSYGFGVQGNLLQVHSDSVGGDIAFGYGSSAAMTETMRIKGSGNVGIGTSTPSGKLTVNGGVRARGGAPGGGGASDNGFSFTGNGGDNDSGMFSSAGGQLEFYGNNVERMRIASSGNVGINTATPTATLEVNGAIKATSVTVNGTVSAAEFTGTFNGEKPPQTYTIAPGNLASWRQISVDTSALLGDSDGGRIRFILRWHSAGQIRTYDANIYAEQDSDFGKPTTAGRWVWGQTTYAQEGYGIIGSSDVNQRYDIIAHPWDWCYVRNYSSNEATGAGTGPAMNYANRFTFFFMVRPDISATIIIYDR